MLVFRGVEPENDGVETDFPQGCILRFHVYLAGCRYEGTLLPMEVKNGCISNRIVTF